MKRFFLYAMMVAGALASCSQSENGDLPEGGSENSKPDADKILISAVSPSVSVNVTRSSGTIGADGTTLNTGWSGQELYVFGYRKEDGVAQITTNADDWVFNSQYQKAIAEKGADTPNSTTLKWVDTATGSEDATLYYPRSNYYDFFGYYADEASNVDNVAIANGTASVPFVITGAEDLMIAKTTPSSDVVAADKLFGSYAARHGVQPVMTFEHQLTRLVFKVATPAPANPAAPTPTEQKNIEEAKNVYVKSIEIESKTTGNLIFAYTAPDVDPLAWTNNDRAYLSLKERNAGVMQDLNTGITIPSLPESKDEFTGTLGKYAASESGTLVGEALLVEPDASEYQMKVTVMQYYDGSGKLIPEARREYTYPLDKTKLLASAVTGGVGATTTFKRSHSYNITITVYGVQDIKITAQLGDWIFGGDLPVDPEM